MCRRCDEEDERVAIVIRYFEIIFVLLKDIFSEHRVGVSEEKKFIGEVRLG